jgi:hypothetical protein
MIYFGDGTKDLDGSGGNFEFTMELGSQVNQPEPQIIYFSTDTQASVFTEQFPLYRNETVVIKVKSPNAADTDVYVHACIIEVGVESIRDDLALIIANQRIVKNVYDDTGGADGEGTSRGVYPEKC